MKEISDEKREILVSDANKKYDEERLERFYKTVPIPNYIKDNELDFYDSPYRKDIIDNLVVGQHFLFQLGNENGMSIPVIATFVGHTICDQALEINYIIPSRTWELNKSLSIAKDFDIYTLYKSNTVEVESVIEWSDCVYVFGVWDKFPSWQEIKPAMKETFYYRLSRKDKIARILN